MSLMRILEIFKHDAGTKAYRTHAKANRLNDSGKIAESEATYKKAMELYIKAEATDCMNAKILTGYCILLMRENKHEQALELLPRIMSDPIITTDDKYHLDLDHAVCLWKLGRMDEAMAEMEELGKQRKLGIYYNVTGAMLVQRAIETGDFAEAAEFMEKAMEYDDDDISTIDNHGWLKYYTGDTDAALEAFKTCIGKNMNYAPALTGIARIALDRGKTDTARKNIDRALAVHFPTTTPVSRAFAEALKKEIG